jgi:hypothetical protein
MSGFCINCGTALGGQAGFCPNCGMQIGQAAAAGSSGLKIVVLVVGVLFVFGALAIAGMYFAGRRLVNHIELATGHPGLASSIANAASSESASGNAGRSATQGGLLGSLHSAAAGKRDGCSLLSKNEVESILGTTINRVDGASTASESGEHCGYFVKPGTMEQDEAKIRQSAEEFKAKQAAIDKLNGSNLNEQARKEGVENVAKNLMRALAASDGSGDAPLFSFSVDRENGKSQFGAFRTANVLLGSAAQGSVESLSGLGDRAVMGPMDSILCVLKDNTCITLNLLQVPDGKEKGVALARKILARL